MDTWFIFFISLSRWILGTTLFLAAMTKWLDLANFQRLIVRWHLGRQEWSPIIARGVPGLEFLIGLALLLNLYPKLVAVFSIGLLTIFTLVLTVRLVKGETEGCGCFGSSKNDKITSLTLIRNAFLLILSFLILQTPNTNWNPLSIPLVLSIVSFVLAKARTSSNHNHAKQTITPSRISDLSRRDFLKRMGNTSLGLLGIIVLNRLGIGPVPNDPSCPCTQTYQHYESTCGTYGCTFAQRRHHVWTRTCESCYCGCGSSCRTAWGNESTWCVVCGDVCDSITPNCGCACNYCNPCACSH